MAMGAIRYQPPILRAFARSRRKPVRRDVHLLHKVRLFYDETFRWRIMPKRGDLAGYLAAVETQLVQLRRVSEAELTRLIAADKTKAEDILIPARGAPLFALVLEVIRRQVGFSLRDNQIACALTLLRGECVELKTGEGKTLAAGLAALVAALTGVSVHVITVNDYLAERDHELMRPMAVRLGLRSAVLLQDDNDDQKKASYDVDVLYGTNKIFVFDHLRDRREGRTKSDAVPRQMGQAMAIVDEVDSVLVDDATVPMILSEQANAPPAVDVALFKALGVFTAGLEPDVDRVLDANGSWRLTVTGVSKLQSAARHWRHPIARTEDILELAELSLSARHSFRQDVAFVVKDDAVVMIDQPTGRLMPDRRWAYGLQQMVELHVGLKPTPETRTVGQITQQTYFRQYRILSGLTGTAKECRGEFWAIYGLPVRAIAPHAPSQLRDLGFRVFGTAAEKWQFVHDQATEIGKTRAVLIGMNDVAEAAALAALFAQSGREVSVLDALSEAQEAELVEVAGQPGRITIATHLAGRGTDIALGQGVREAGGLHVIIASVMASGRLERQLYGRAGRQGDPGSYQRVISLEDRGLSEGAQSLYRRFMTGLIHLRVLSSFALAQVQANRDRRSRAMRRRTLLREQELARQLGYR